MLSLNDIQLDYGDGHDVLKNLSVRFSAGSFTVLVGASGCGKSSLLRLIAGLQPPTAGSIEHALGKGDIGFVFQEPTLMDWARVKENVALPLKLAGIQHNMIAQRVNDALSMVGLNKRQAAYPHELSGGMKMRVSVARALVTRPKLLLLDEPFAALDEITRINLEDDLLRIWRETGCTVVFVTHHVSSGVFLAQKVLVMGAAGQIENMTLEKTNKSRNSHELQNQTVKILDKLIAFSQGGTDD